MNKYLPFRGRTNGEGRKEGDISQPNYHGLQTEHESIPNRELFFVVCVW